MSTQNAEWRFLISTFFIVATLAVPTLASILSGPEDVPALALRPQEQKTRQPASLPSLAANRASVIVQDSHKELSRMFDNKLVSFDLSCAKASVVDYKIEGTYFQLKGKDCGKGSENSKVSITNKTNGFTASVFFTSGKEYQTDLIQLKDGENQIVIQYQDALGHQEEHVLNVKAGTI